MKKNYLWLFLAIALCAFGSSILFLPKSFARTSPGLHLSLTNETVEKGGKLYLAINGDAFEDVSINMCSTISDYCFINYVADLKTAPYLPVPENVSVGEAYIVQDVFTFYKDRSESTHYSTDDAVVRSNPGVLPLKVDGNDRVAVIDNVNASISKLATKEARSYELGEKVYLDFEYQANFDVSKIEILLASDLEHVSPNFAGEILKDKNGYYFTVSSDYPVGVYKYQTIYFYQKGKTNPVLGLTNSSIPYAGTTKFLPYVSNFSVGVVPKKQESSTPTATQLLKSFQSSAKDVKKNQRVSVSLDTSETLESALLFFYRQDGESVPVYLKDVNKNPYYIVPYTMSEGSYSLGYMILKSTSGKEEHYQSKEAADPIKHFDFNTTIAVKGIDSSAKDLVLDNDSLTDELIRDMANINKQAVITINANKDSVIKASLFKMLKNTSKTLIVNYNKNQWIFSGKDITDPKDIDVSLNLTDTLPASIAGVLTDGYVIEYKNNGYLPGKAMARIYATDELTKYFGNTALYAYYYDEATNKLQEVSTHVIRSDDGYYEFYMNHNSKYILTSTKVANEHLIDNNSMLELNKVTSPESNIMLYSIIGVLGSIVLILIVLIVKSKKNEKR